MPSPTPTPPAGRTARRVLIAIGLVALAVVIWRIADVLVVMFGGIVIAAVLRAIAVPLARKTGLRERWSVLVVVVALLLVGAGLGWFFGQEAAQQATELRQQLPAAADKFLLWVERWPTGDSIVTALSHSMDGAKILSPIGIAATAALAVIADLLLVLFLGVYFAVDPRLYRDGALRLIPPSYRHRVGRAMDDAGEALQRWLVGQLIAMGTVGVLVGIGMALVGVPLALTLGVLAALLEFVPVVGPILFSIPGLLLAFATGPETVLYALLVYVVVQQFESNVLIPVLQRWAVELPPVVGLLAVVIGGLLLGVAGLVFATPLAVVIMRLVQHLYVEDTLENRPIQSRPETATTAK